MSEKVKGPRIHKTMDYEIHPDYVEILKRNVKHEFMQKQFDHTILKACETI